MAQAVFLPSGEFAEVVGKSRLLAENQPKVGQKASFLADFCVATQKLIETKSESQPIWLGVVFLLLWGVRSKEWGTLLWKWGACSEFWGVELKKRHDREEKSRFSIWSCTFYSFPAGHFFAADKKGLIEKMQFFVIAKYRYEKNITGNKALFWPEALEKLPYLWYNKNAIRWNWTFSMERHWKRTG